jgi:hypothetical protein
VASPPRREKREDSATLSPEELQTEIADATGAALGSLRAALGTMRTSGSLSGGGGEPAVAAASDNSDDGDDDLAYAQAAADV